MREVEKHPVVSRIESEVEQTLNDYGYELVQVTFGGRGAGRVLSVYIDKPGGVTAADCQHMAEQLSLLLDAIDPIEGGYHLMVSSPGVERPLIHDSDFDRFAGRQAAVTDTTDAGKQTRHGTLLGVDAGDVLLETEDGVVRIALETIDGGHLLYDFDDDLLA